MGLALIWSPGAVRNPSPLSSLRLKPAEVMVPSKLPKAVKTNRQLPNVTFAVDPPFWIPTDGMKLLFALFELLPTKLQLFIVTIALPAADPKFAMPPPEACGIPPPPAPPLPELAEVKLLLRV